MVGVQLYELKCKKLNDCTIKVNKIDWAKNSDTFFNYIDLSSVSRENQSIEDTNVIDKKSAPTRAQQIIQKEDILFGTTRPLLKMFTIVPSEYDNQICSAGFCVLRAKKNMILPKWIFYNITSNLFLSYAENHQKGTSYPAISDKEVKKDIDVFPMFLCTGFLFFSCSTI